MASPILIKIIFMFAGALLLSYLAKLTIIRLDENTNVVMPTLIFMLLVSVTLFAKILGF